MTPPATSKFPRLDIAALTDKGIKRSANEDAYGLFDLPQTDAAIVVSDGMGGLQAGDIASEESVSVIEETLRERLNAGDTPEDALREAFRRANDRVYAIAETVRRQAEETAKQEEADMPTAKRGDYSKSAPAPKSSTPLMGATVVAALLQGETLTVAHAGDSRLYRLRNGVLTSLTFDHSFVAERVRAGDISEAEARVSRFRNMITRAVGIDGNIQPEIQSETVAVGDVLLLCTDGLNTMIDDEEIAAILAQSSASSAETAAVSLVAAANQRGGSDNITVVVLRVMESSPDTTIVMAPAVKTSAAERPVVVPLEERRPAKRPDVVNMDVARSNGGRRAGSTPPFVGFLAFVGILTLGVGAILAAAKDVRQNIGRMLAPTPTPTPVVATSPGGTMTGNVIRIKDYSKMKYNPPVAFGDTTYSVRGDLLSYSPKVGILFVTDSTGQLTVLSKTGKPVRAVATFDVPTPPPTPVPSSRVFYATDLQGNVYISYPARKLIEKIGRDGQVLFRKKSTERPEALTVDEDGNLYVIYDSEIKKLEAIPIVKGTASPSPNTSPRPKATAASPTAKASATP
ncbi:MAG: protein phosphatase 2C domain-containing protein [Akkermansiaceae bacterium]|nr:protein phosphatase 2C domain-containing protein [Armatimonadota bacterium]